MSHLKYLVCPECKGELNCSSTLCRDNTDVVDGTLTCNTCAANYPIVRSIPRFVPLDNYASGFGFEWNRHARTQYDSYSGLNLSETRFFNETKWPRDLKGEVIVEIGSGSGRFTEQAASTGAMIVSMDYSSAVDANYASNGSRPNVLIVQADLYKPPFGLGSFDRLFCFGVLQHTPDVARAVKLLPTYVKPNGSLAFDVYRKAKALARFTPSVRWLAPVARMLPHRRLYSICAAYVELVWPVAAIWSKSHYARTLLDHVFALPNYRGVYDLSDALLKEWAVLDLFDDISPVYTNRQTIEKARSWLEEAALANIEVQRGYNGIECRAVRTAGAGFPLPGAQLPQE